jgi:hypothetical protein
MTTPSPEDLGEAIAALADVPEGETRVDHLVHVDLPPGAEDGRPWLLPDAVRLAGDDHLSLTYPVDSAVTAVILASVLARDWRNLGVDVTAIPLRATWLLIAEEEIL